MITIRKPNERELRALAAQILPSIAPEWELGKKHWREAKRKVAEARCIAVFDNYAFEFTKYPQYRKLYEDKLMLVIWDDDPYHCEVYLMEKSGELASVHQAIPD